MSPKKATDLPLLFLHGYDSLGKIELLNKPFRKAIPCIFTITQIMNNPKLFEGREGKHKPSELYIAFLYLELGRFDASIATFFTVHGGLCYNTVLLGGDERQQKNSFLNWLHLTGKDVSL